MAEEPVFKKSQRVRVRTPVGPYKDEVGTIVDSSVWVYARPGDICYLIALDNGVNVTCDEEDLQLWEKKEG